MLNAVYTLSPTFSFSTSEPMLLTIPAPSKPGVKGRDTHEAAPERQYVSTGFTPAACIVTTTRSFH